MATATSLGMTLEAWGLLAEDVEGELVDGHLEEEEMPSAIHETVVLWIAILLKGYFGARGGFVFASGIKLGVRATRGRIADVVCFTKERRPELRGVVRAVPEIAVEVVSPTPNDERRDRIVKPDDYAAMGVRYYWLVDPELRSFEIWELGDDRRYVRACAAIEGKVENVPGCHGLLVDLDELWAEVDRLASD